MITDIDKDSFDRGRPSPNSHDQLNHNSVMSRGTNSVNYVTPASNQAVLTAGKNGQFTIVQSQTFTTTSTYSTTNPGTGNYISDNFVVYQQPHSLNFLPGILAYELSSAGQYTPMPYTRYQTQSSTQGVWYTFYIVIDSTYVTIALNTMTYGNLSVNFTPGFIFKWYLLQQTSN